jgi:hypothetical protein
MSLKRIVGLAALALITSIFSGCRTGNPIDYDTAMALLKDRNMEPVKLTISAAPPQNGDLRTKQAYERLIDAHVIVCSDTQAIGKICEPGPTGEALSLEGSTELALVAGRWVPAVISNISRSGDGSATAEVRMTFEPSPTYRDFESAFDDIQQAGGHGPVDKTVKLVRAVYQRLEDGWHLDSVN